MQRQSQIEKSTKEELDNYIKPFEDYLKRPLLWVNSKKIDKVN